MPEFKKTIKYDEVSKEKIALEVELQNVVYKYKFTPKIYNVKYNKNEAVITMENLNEMCLADKYGEEPFDIPNHYWKQIRTILETLLYEEGIEYIDITPYNFIEKEDKIYIIDFGHAYYTNTGKKINWFLQELLDGSNSWNPDFK
jgi:tRNA A-37 threonylcarbamoyl transferase component Bud32